MPDKIRLTESQIESLAKEIQKLLHTNGLWGGTYIYFNGCCMDSVDETGRTHYDGSVYVHPDIEPTDRFCLQLETNLWEGGLVRKTEGRP